MVSGKFKCQEKRGWWFLLPAVLYFFFFFSHMLLYLRCRLAPRVDGEGWLFPAWCFLGTPVPNQLKISWKYSVSGGKCKGSLRFPQVYLGVFCTECFPEESERFEAASTKRELSCSASISSIMAFAIIRTERSKKYFLCLIPACCSDGRFFPN